MNEQHSPRVHLGFGGGGTFFGSPRGGGEGPVTGLLAMGGVMGVVEEESFGEVTEMRPVVGGDVEVRGGGEGVGFEPVFEGSDIPTEIFKIDGGDTGAVDPVLRGGGRGGPAVFLSAEAARLSGGGAVP